MEDSFNTDGPGRGGSPGLNVTVGVGFERL